MKKKSVHCVNVCKGREFLAGEERFLLRIIQDIMDLIIENAKTCED